MPVYVIHSRDDEVVPIDPARDAADALKEGGTPVEFLELTRIGHFAMGGYVDALRQAGRWMWDQWER